ncbi:hypothetical protein B566_EDAN016211 [Ephemera danica]|nr:hypothetical protein B566_EDAN016211 [Ephemera danica]
MISDDSFLTFCPMPEYETQADASFIVLINFFHANVMRIRYL